MLDRIETKGYFFLPENSDERLDGILKFNQDDGVELDIFGDFDSFSNVSSQDARIVLGFTSEGKKITLLNCYQKSGNWSFPGFSHSKISAVYLFIGQHFNSVNDFIFESCSIGYEGLNNWLSISGFDKPIYNADRDELTIKYRCPNKIEFNIIDDWDAEIEFKYYAPMEFFTPIEKVEIVQRPCVKLIPKIKSGLKLFEKYIQSFTTFFTINYYSFPLIQSLVFYEAIEKENELDPGLNKIELFYQIGINIQESKKHSHKTHYLIQYYTYQHQFQQVINKWFVLFRQIEVSINILTECFMERSKSTESQFLSLVQAIENMHRRTTNTSMTLLKRLNNTVDNLPEKIKRALLNNELDFTKRITGNRNYYTHYSDNYKENAASLSELFILSEKLKIILIVSILKELLFTNEQIEGIFFSKGVYLFNHIISPQLAMQFNK